VEVSTVSHGQAIVIAVSGRLDSATGPELETQLLDLIAHGHRRMIIDLAGLAYISSVGLRALIVAAKQLTTEGGRLVLVAPGAIVNQVLGVSGLSGLLDTYTTTEEALARAVT
jgi:anti-anti-sigma factor